MFQTYIESVLLYNAELWALTDSEEARLISFHNNMTKFVSKRDRKEEINRLKYDPGCCVKIRREYGLRPVIDILRERRLLWLAEVWVGGGGIQKEELRIEINESGAWWKMVTRDMEELGISWGWFRDEVEKWGTEDREALKEFVKTLFTPVRNESESPNDGEEKYIV